MHTPGPWKLANSGYANAPSVIYAGDKAPDFGARYPLQGCDWIAEVRQDESPRGREFHANARLMKAAPELLLALEQIVQQLDGAQVSDNESGDNRPMPIPYALAVIRKARGGQ